MNRSVTKMPVVSRFRLLLAIGAIAGLLPVLTWTAFAAMSPGSIQGLEGWSGGTIAISPSVDQAVDHSGVNQRSGRAAWRISNNTALGSHNGAFAGWAFGPGLVVAAGQPSSGAGADQFSATLWFRSASATADGSNIEIDLGSALGDDRDTFLALTNRADADGGLQLRAGEPDGATGGFRPTAVIATGIARGAWHRLDILANYYDGPTNDTVEYALDGVVVANPAGGTTFGTFEGYREGLGTPYVLVNRMVFRSGAAPNSYGAFDAAAARGFYFDDLTYSVAKQSAPDSALATYGTGFEAGMSAGSIQGQDVWSGGTMPIAASVDQVVDHAGLDQRTGQGTWRISNNTSLGNYNGNFAGWPFGPTLAVTAGQPSSGAGADQFSATLWFRSASASADGSNIEIDLGSALGDDRDTFLALTNRADADGGLQLRAGEPDGATGEFRPTVVIAAGIVRSEWHRLDILATYRNGATNDTVEYALDGVALANPAGGTTFGTLEGYREGLGTPYVLVNRLFFRSGGAPSNYGAFDAAAARGFFFDDVTYAVAKQSAPASPLATYATGFEPAAVPTQDLTVSMSHTGNFVQGQVGAQFVVRVTNNGSPRTIGNVTLIDTLPAGLTPTGASGTGWNCGVAGATVTCTRSDSLAPGASYAPITITVNVAGNAAASVTNTATVAGGGESNTANNTATDAITVLPGASQVDLGVTITDGRPTYLPGTAISYRITVTNAGPSTAAGFSILDNVPAAMTGVSVTCAVTGSGSCGTNGTSGNHVNVTLATLAPGAGNALTLTVNGSLKMSASGTLVNTATVATGANTTDVNPGNNSATDTDWQETSVILNDGGDFDGDGKTDIAVFRPLTNEWHIFNSSTGAAEQYFWGGLGDIPVVGDYDGDVKADIAVFRPSTGEWHIFNSSSWTGDTFVWGGVGDVPVPADYDGDGKTDLAVFRPATGAWYVLKSHTWTGEMITWGSVGDIAVPRDYDGDGKADITVFRPSSGDWHVLKSSTLSAGTFTWGGAGDIPVARDYDGDGKADIAVFRPSTGAWHIVYSSTLTPATLTWGGVGDIPVARDYDGDDKADIAVFRPLTGEWFTLQSSTGSGETLTWGGVADLPL